MFQTTGTPISRLDYDLGPFYTLGSKGKTSYCTSEIVKSSRFITYDDITGAIDQICDNNTKFTNLVVV